MPDEKNPVVAATVAMAAEQARQREMARAEVDAERITAKHEAVPGGRYLVGGVLVDASGTPLADKKPD